MTVVFLDTYLHQVDNATEEDRVVLLVHFDRPMDLAGRLVHRTMLALLRRSGFVKQAKRRHEEWEERFRRQE